MLAWRASQRAGLGRNACRAWRLLAIALLIYLTGDLLQLAYEAGLRRTYPTWAYLSFYPVAFWGLISFQDRRRSGQEWLRLLLDAGMVFAGAWMLIWYVALGPDTMGATQMARQPALCPNPALGLACLNIATQSYCRCGPPVLQASSERA